MPQPQIDPNDKFESCDHQSIINSCGSKKRQEVFVQSRSFDFPTFFQFHKCSRLKQSGALDLELMGLMTGCRGNRFRRLAGANAAGTICTGSCKQPPGGAPLLKSPPFLRRLEEEMMNGNLAGMLRAATIHESAAAAAAAAELVNAP